MRVRSSAPWPLGAHVTERGVAFAVFSANATEIEVCLFDSPTGPEVARVQLPERTDGVFHGLVEGIGEGQLYGLRAHGPFAPSAGHRFNPHRLLVDPYARALCGAVDRERDLRGHTRERRRGSDPPPRSLRAHHPGTHLPRAALSEGPASAATRIDEHDTAAAVPKGVVLDDRFDWGDDRAPAVPWSDTVIYEAHVKSMTMLHPDVPAEHRGTYLGLAHPAVTDHLVRLGVTAIELLPVQQHVDEPFLAARGLTNHWGYQTLGWFSPEARYAPVGYGDRGGQVRAFKEMVKALHRAGLEVILDVVYNHGCEGDPEGPTLSLRGLDNASYFRLAADKRRYEDVTGCGNTLDLRHPMVLRLVMDSLRYWVSEMHVDGFRFDLATALGRTDRGFEVGAPFFAAIAQDPILQRVKLIAEPWDVGPDGYRVGGFPLGFSEWNGKFRDGVRRFWAGLDPFPRELGYRLTGSSDLYESSGRGTRASVNFITCHDGFTLADLVRYEQKHNEANGEDNRDGTDANDAWNCGVEGPTEDPAIVALRARQAKNLMATLLLSTGVPMLLAGDELGHSQRGNNNAYCQDNELTWLRWPTSRVDESRAPATMTDFVQRLLSLRREHPSLRRARHFDGRVPPGHTRKDLTWINQRGEEMSAGDWQRPCRTFAALIDGEDPMLLILNGERAPATLVMPTCDGVTRWRGALRTSDVDELDGHPTRERFDELLITPGSTVALAALELSVFVAASDKLMPR